MFITGRLKELVKSSAYQVAPAELEALLVPIRGVADAAVIPRPGERAGEARGTPYAIRCERRHRWVAGGPIIPASRRNAASFSPP